MQDYSKLQHLTDPIALEEAVLRLYRKGYAAVDIVDLLANNKRYKLAQNFAPEIVGNTEPLTLKISEIISEFKEHKLVEQIYANEIFMPLNSNHVHIYERKSDKILHTTTLETVKMLTIGDRYLNKLETKLIEGYHPHNRKRFFTNRRGQACFNVYNPPSWKQNWWQTGVEPLNCELPDIYVEFFQHFVEGDADSLNFLFDWAASTLKQKNLNFIFTLSNQGSGKGLLGKIFQKLHGESNSIELKGSAVSRQFNKNFENKTFISIDEISSISGAAVDNIKTFISDDMEIEAKGIDSRVTENFANFYFSSNNMDALEVMNDDRRYSIIDITDKNLREKWGNNEAKYEALTSPKNIEKLAGFLWNRQFNKSVVNTPFRKNRALEVSYANLADWQSHLDAVFAYDNKGKVLLLSDLTKYMQSQGYKVSGKMIVRYIKSSSKSFTWRLSEPEGLVNTYYDFNLNKLLPCGPNFKHRNVRTEVILVN